MFDPSLGLIISVGIIGFGVAVCLLKTVLYIGITNDVEAKIDRIKNDETIVNWDDIMGARMHIDILRHKLKGCQCLIVYEARNKGLPPLVVGILLAMWFFSKT